jgi:hypothetical protein
MTCGAGASIANAGRLFRTGRPATAFPRERGYHTNGGPIAMSCGWVRADARSRTCSGIRRAGGHSTLALPPCAAAASFTSVSPRPYLTTPVPDITFALGYGKGPVRRARGDAARSQPDPRFAGGQVVVQGERNRPVHRRRRPGGRDDGLREPREAACRSVPALRHEGGRVRGARDVPRHMCTSHLPRSTLSNAPLLLAESVSGPLSWPTSELRTQKEERKPSYSKRLRRPTSKSPRGEPYRGPTCHVALLRKRTGNVDPLRGLFAYLFRPARQSAHGHRRGSSQ